MKIKKSRVYINLLLFIFLFTLTGIMYQSSNPQYNLETPKPSAGEISIITPENKTIIQSMAGYYPGTFGFENELDGTSRTNIAYVDGTNAIQSNCEVEIINNFQGHNKVLRIHDGNTKGNAAAEHYFDSTQTTGTIEWWWSIPAVSDNRMWIHFHQDQMSTIAFSLAAVDDEFFQNNGTAVQTYNFNQWYHHKISFNTISDTYDWYIDGMMVVNGGVFENPVLNIGSTNIKGAWQTTGESYFDAFGYSWKSNYDIGDNVNEGLLLSYETTTNLDWQGYSLDGNANIIIFGSTTIIMPSIGPHNIQVLGKDTLGTIYQSEIRYFTISPINLITPENKTYTEPMRGYYPATYGFEHDEVGTIPDEWTEVAPSGSCSISVQDQKDNHEKVVLIADADTATGEGADATAQYDLKSPKVKGTIECWVYKESGICALVIQGNKDTTTAFIIKIDSNNNGMFHYSPAPSTYVEFATGKYSDQQWFHIRIDFDCDTNTTDIYVNGLKEVENGPFHLPVPDISFIQIRSGNSGASGIIYFDAVGLSWDQSYSLGDNLNEGLLLSYETTTNLDWQGYSLDGNANKTILGNTTIPIPANGVHSIQVFGNDSMGTMHESAIQHFSVDTTSFINIITPENTGYFEPMSGYFLGSTGFEDTENGFLPLNMDDLASGSNCQATVVSEKTEHNNIVHIDDDSSTNMVRLNYNFTNLNYGFLEFWILAEDATDELVMQLWDDDTATDLFQFNLNNNNWHYYDNSYWTRISAFDGFCNPEDNTWYHVAVHFRGNGAPAYQGLNENQYKLIINGRDSGRINFNNIGASVERLRFYTSDYPISDFWIDAIGGSHDLNYNLGDNLNEGLLLSFNHSDNFDWIGYSLDGNPNIIIKGNKVIPIPENGIHSVILNGITTEGMLIQSDLRYFITNIQSPPTQPENPNLIPIFLTSLVIGIVALLSITFFLLRRKKSPRTSFIMPYQIEAQVNENVDSRRDQPNFCPFCGSRIEIPSRFCAFCGASLKNL